MNGFCLKSSEEGFTLPAYTINLGKDFNIGRAHGLQARKDNAFLLGCKIMGTRRIYNYKYPVLITTNIVDGNGFLDKTEIATIISDHLISSEKHYKYDLLGFAIMPNHVHILLKTDQSISYSLIMQIFKSYTYYQIRNLLDIKYKFWQKSFDYRIKDSLELFITAISYIKNNPLKWKLPAKYFTLPYQYFNHHKLQMVKNIFKRSEEGIALPA